VPRLPASEAPGKKKALHASARETERVQTLRTACRATVHPLDVPRLQCVDASGITLAMIRRYGRAAPGQRVVDHVPDNEGSNDTLLAALGLEGLDAPWGVDGAVTGAICRWWVGAVLCPTLQPGDIGLWENLSAHTVAGIEALITARGARLLPLSPYAPDCNPLEPCWSKSKTALRRAKARTVDTWCDAVTQALDTITEADMRGWFTHCGYPIQ
jgi:DDE superfamily endonuclease